MRLKSLGVVGVAAATLLGSTMLTAEKADARPFGGYGYRGGFGGYRGGYYRRGYGYGGVGLGLGLASGLAIGALASGYPYGGYGGYPGYYGASYYGGYGGCYLQPRRVWGPYGPYIANVRVCY